jgi:hypothetical protein
VLGKVWYRSRAGFPWRVEGADSVPEARFLGYRLVDGGYPEFHYRVGDAEVRETVRGRDGGGLVRSFEIRTDRPLRFRADPEGGARFESSAGRWSGNVLELTPQQARRFTLTMTPAAEASR